MASEAWERFAASLPLDHERWHDGIGVDLDALAALKGADRERAEAALLAVQPPTWREVEGLAALDTPSARAALRAVASAGDVAARMAVLRHAPDVVSEAARDALLVDALREATIGDGLTAVLDQVEAHHPPVVRDALVARARDRPGEAAVHLAALADYLLGPATEAFDWDHRPLYLRFVAPPGSAEREAAWRELCARIGVDPDGPPA